MIDRDPRGAAPVRPRLTAPRRLATLVVESAIFTACIVSHRAALAAPAIDPAVVELYKEARALVAEGKWDEGCPKFDQAMAKQPTTSILINVGDCHAHQGKLAKAMDDYEVARELNRDTDDEGRRVALASEIELRVKKLAPRIPMLRIIVENPVEGMVIECDGALIEPDKIGIDIPVDPGPHTITADAAGFEAAPRQITLAEADRQRVTLKLTRRSFASQHRLSIVLGVGALAFAGAGGGLTAWRASTESSLPQLCAQGPEPCQRARTDLDTGTIGMVAAFAAAGAAAGAAVLVFTVAERPKAPRVTAAVTGSFGSVAVTW